VTTSTDSRSTLYRSKNADAGGRAITVATVIAAILTAVGAASMIAGLAGAVGFTGLDPARTALFVGIGLVAMGSGGLLLVILQGYRLAR
jgi:hypothetical protein